MRVLHLWLEAERGDALHGLTAVLLMGQVLGRSLRHEVRGRAGGPPPAGRGPGESAPPLARSRAGRPTGGTGECSQEMLGLSAIVGSVGVIRSAARVREAGQGRRLRPRQRWLQVRDHRGQGQALRGCWSEPPSGRPADRGGTGLSGRRQRVFYSGRPGAPWPPPLDVRHRRQVLG